MGLLNLAPNRKDADAHNEHFALSEDLEVALEVHNALFPQENLSIPGLAFETFYKPARCIGGDYHDFLSLRPDRCGIAIGDICGKGIGAALLMANLQASLRARAMHPYSDLSTLIADVDRLFRAASPRHLYASLFYAEYDAATRVLRYVNAGHNAPMVLRWKQSQCEVFHLKSSGPALAILENSQFISKALQLEKGDVFVGYTDGITESQSPFDDFWGQERLETLLRACHDCTPTEIVQRILDEVLAFTKDRSQGDDMTLVVLRVKDEAGI